LYIGVAADIYEAVFLLVKAYLESFCVPFCQVAFHMCCWYHLKQSVVFGSWVILAIRSFSLHGNVTCYTVPEICYDECFI